jgi:hypothetical protein
MYFKASVWMLHFYFMSCRSSLSFLNSVLHMTFITHPILLPVINIGLFIRPPITSATGWSASLHLHHSSKSGLSFNLWGFYITLPKPPDLNVSYCNFPRPTHIWSMNSLYSLPEATPFPVPPLPCSFKQIWVNVVVNAVDPSSVFSVIDIFGFLMGGFFGYLEGTSPLHFCFLCEKYWALHPNIGPAMLQQVSHCLWMKAHPLPLCFLSSILDVQAFTFWMPLLCLMLLCSCSVARELMVATPSTWCCKHMWMAEWSGLQYEMNPTLSLLL